MPHASVLSQNLARLSQPGGVFRPSIRVQPLTGEAKFTIRLVDVGRCGGASPPHAGLQNAGRRGITTVGTSMNDDEATLLAHVEGLERYSACVFHDSQFIVASANELGADAIALDSLPRCSATELAHPKCRTVAPRKNVAIRWVRGWSIFDARMVHIPAGLVYLNVPLGAAERLAVPITTGCAAYTSYEGALLRGILEVIERDSLTLVWLQRLQLPRIDTDVVPKDLALAWEQYQHASPDLECIFFDATTDVGVCTVYALQIAHSDPRVHTLVGCATDCSPSRAIAKTIRDLTHIRTALRHERVIPSDWSDFSDVLDGATYMARASQAPAFEFLTQTPHTRSLSSMAVDADPNDKDALSAVLGRLRRLGCDVYAVDLTTDEARHCGINVVRVVIPALQPLSFFYDTRYLGHPRLYDAPRRMGYHASPECDLNQYPQPFA